MKASYFRTYALSGCLLLGSGCARPIAVLEQRPEASYLRLKGKFKPMAHDPFALLFGHRFNDSIAFQLPVAATGVIAGATIPHEPHTLNYSGSIRLESKTGRATLRLFYEIPDAGPYPLMWNGSYKLVTK